MILAACIGGKKQEGSRKVLRIEHPHIVEDSEYECSACGARFGEKRMSCPKCGAKFEGTRVDNTEFDEEMIIEEWIE